MKDIEKNIRREHKGEHQDHEANNNRIQNIA